MSEVVTDSGSDSLIFWRVIKLIDLFCIIRRAFSKINFFLVNSLFAFKTKGSKNLHRVHSSAIYIISLRNLHNFNNHIFLSICVFRLERPKRLWSHFQIFFAILDMGVKRYWKILGKAQFRTQRFSLYRY